jgi:hypothetical protein
MAHLHFFSHWFSFFFFFLKTDWYHSDLLYGWPTCTSFFLLPRLFLFLSFFFVSLSWFIECSHEQQLYKQKIERLTGYYLEAYCTGALLIPLLFFFVSLLNSLTILLHIIILYYCKGNYFGQEGKEKKNERKTTAPRIPMWSPTMVLTRRYSG